MSIIGSNILAGASGQAGGAGAYEIERSVRFSSSDSAFLSRVFTSSGDRTKWTWAAWIKRSSFSSLTFLFHSEVDAYNETVFFFNSSDQLELYNYQAGSFDARKTSSAVFRDPSAWYHIVVAWDTANATAADRVRLYANGSRITSFSSSIDPAQNTTSAGINVNRSHRIGSRDNTVNYLLNGCLADVFFVDAQGLDPTSFGEFDTNGVWQPIDASGLTFGTTGFHLPFSDNSTAAALGTDTSSNRNTWTVNNISVTAGAGNDSVVDSPTNYGTGDSGGDVRGNFCTWSPLDAVVNSTLSNGNLDITNTGDGAQRIGSMGVSSGKWYYEFVQTVNASAQPGINSEREATTYATRLMYYVTGQKYNGPTGSAYGATWTTNDVIGIALDLDAGTLVFYKNGVSQGTAFTGLSAHGIPGFVLTPQAVSVLQTLGNDLLLIPYPVTTLGAPPTCPPAQSPLAAASLVMPTPTDRLSISTVCLPL
jgi:hypothetical protein